MPGSNKKHDNIKENSMQRMVLIIILLGFSALTGVALWHHGYWGIVKTGLQSVGAVQILVDLVIALALFLVWMWRDAAAKGRNPWPWLVLTLASGSFGPLLYLVTDGTGSGPRTIPEQSR